MIVVDFECYKYDWLVCFLDTNTRKMHFIVNDVEKFKKMYDYYKNDIWITYNGRGYDQYIAKGILAGFNPYDISQWIIVQDRKGFEFSRLLNQFPILVYDCSVGFRSLKELQAFSGHSIVETSVPFDIDRKLTPSEIEETISYCKNDVWETFEVFVETKSEFESHVGLIKEFNLDPTCISKTKAQISAIILGANKVKRNDEFDIRFPDTLELGKYKWVADWYKEWAEKSQDYENMKLETEINGVPHTYGIGGLHGSQDKYFGEGIYIMADVASYYPAMMIEYNFVSRNVLSPAKYKQLRDDRIVMKANHDPREYPRKIVLNGTFGASKDRYNNLYDPLQANNICIAGQLLLTDLLDKLDGKCELIQSNTDGILVKVNNYDEKDEVISICQKWSARTRMDLEFDEYCKVIQSNVNNYIIIDAKGNVKRKGAVVKKLSPLDNDLPIVNKAVVDYFIHNVPVANTIMSSTKLIDFQKITKISGKYEYGSHNGVILHEKVHRCFASLDPKDGTLYKKHKLKTTLDKTASTPEHCFIDNDNILDKEVPLKLNREWYIELALDRIANFI